MKPANQPHRHGGKTPGGWQDRLITLLTQYPLPHHFLSWLMWVLTRSRDLAWKNWQIRWFIRRYQVDMEDVLEPDHDDYPNFNSFFTRALKPASRPIASGRGQIASPVDGTVSQLGDIDDSRMVQAKGFHYSVQELLGGSQARAAPFMGGSFATLYLAPRDYHRIHTPLTGRLQEMVHIPGRLFSVSPRTTNTVPRLFTRNERVVALFESELGPMALVLVGALFVGSIETVWWKEGPIKGKKHVQIWDYRARPPGSEIILHKGEELGRFNMGSTVIVLFGPHRMRWSDSVQPDTHVKMGQLVGHRRPRQDDY